MMETKTKKIKALSLKRIEEGSIGFMPTDEENWYNILGEPEILKELIEKTVSKGNIIEFEFNNGVVGSIKLIEKAEKESGNWKEEMTNYEDLLDTAHKLFPNRISIKTEFVRDEKDKPMVDYENKRALIVASVSIEYAEEDANALGKHRTTLFTGHGDSEGILSDTIKPHFIRMAETRAIARALRWATNNAKVSEEETSGAKDE